MKNQLFVCHLTLITLVAFALPVMAQPPEPNTTNKLHMTSKPAVVRILSGYAAQWRWRDRPWNTQLISSGSGFIINPNGYILTNAHVVSDIKNGDEAGKQVMLQQLAGQVLRGMGYEVSDANLSRALRLLAEEAELTALQRVNYVFLQSGKRFPYEIKSFGAPIGEGKDLLMGKDVAVIKIEVKNAPTLRLGNSDNAQVGDGVWIIGYPAAGDSAALDEKSALEPTTNDGRISARKTSADGAPILQTNASTTHGNSGGPVINEKGEVVGLLTFGGNRVYGQEVQGFSFIVPVNTAAEFVRQAGTDNQFSPIDAKWMEGLSQFWQQKYTPAKESFQEVLALFADHSEAQRLITEAQERIARGEEKSGFSFEITGWKALPMIAVIFLLPIATIAGLIFLVRRKRQTAPVATRLPMTQVAPRQPPAAVRAEVAVPVAAPVLQSTTPFARPATAELSSVARTQAFVPLAAAKLIFVSGPLQGQEFIIGQGLYIGRDRQRAQVVVTDPQVSGRHVWVGPVNGSIIARDQASTNGTYLNDRLTQRITETELHDADTLTLGAQGSVRCRLQC